LGDVDNNRKFLARLMQTQVTIQSDKIRGPFRVFRGRQRAIAEVMMVPTTGANEGPRSECIGYAAFCDRLDNDPEFKGVVRAHARTTSICWSPATRMIA
jgi:hypothetical protein